MSGQDFNRIISHELIHIKQYHSIDILIMELVTIFHWFNPFVWPYKKSLKETHEYLADNGVIAQGCSPARYQMLIVEQHVGVKLFEFANNFKHSQIKRRITMMTKIKSKSWAKFKVLLILPLASLLVLAFAESKPITTTDLSEIHDAADSNPPIFTASPEDPKQEKKLQELKKKYKALAAELEKTEDPKKRDAIKKEMQILKMKASSNGDKGNGNSKMTKMEVIKAKYKELAAAYEKTDNPEKKADIKKMMAELKEMAVKEEKLAKEKTKENGELSDKEMLEKEIQKLKVMYDQTDDPEKKAAIKKKLQKLLQKAESLK